MTKKLQQFYIISLQSSRLKKNNYKIKNFSIEEARKNSELISIGDSQMLRTIRDVRRIAFSQEDLNILWNKRSSLKKKKNSDKRSDEIQILSKQIDSILFVEDVVSVTFEHTAHYKRMIKDGFFINGNKYVRLFAGAGHLRRSTVLFVRNDIKDILIEKFENGLDKNIPLNHGKYGAYLALNSSSSFEVTVPRFVVVPDLEIKRMRTVDFVEDDNETVSEKNMEISHNVFDGQGLVSMDMAKKWSNDLGLDYDAVSFIIRSSFTKGLLVSFPFHSFAKEFGITTIKDIYGCEYDIKDIDVILTESQFKMSKHFHSLQEFSNNCKKNKLSWGVTRMNPRIEKEYFWSSYQYIQVLDSEVDIPELTRDTVDYFNDVGLMDAKKTLVYMMGEDTKDKDITFDKIDNPIIKVLSVDGNAINDPHIRNNIIRTLNKKIRESYTGKLLLDGNYQFVVFDPYALAQHAFNVDCKKEDLGILKEHEHYSQYWNNKQISKVVSGRSPLTWRSELNTLSFVDSANIEKWLGHLYSGIIFNIHGVDMMLYGDADGDGDAVFTTDNEKMVEGAMKNGKPVTYGRTNAPKENLQYDKFFETDVASFNSKIGLITNYSTTYYSMQSKFEKNSNEYKEIEKRLIICRRGQGNEIDKTKGIITAKFPEWGKRVPDNALHNNILANKRPFWMQYLYPHKKKEWDEHRSNYNYYCYGMWGVCLDDLMKTQNLTYEQNIFLERYKKTSPLLLDGNGVMDKISNQMVVSVKEIKKNSTLNDFDYRIYMDNDVQTSEDIKKQILSLMKLFNKMKKDFYLNSSHEDMSFIIEYIKNKAFEISSDIVKLTNCAVELFYGEMKSNHEFVWQILPDGIINNMRKKYKKFKIPMQSENGEFIFVGKEYKMMEFFINDK